MKFHVHVANRVVPLTPIIGNQSLYMILQAKQQLTGSGLWLTTKITCVNVEKLWGELSFIPSSRKVNNMLLAKESSGKHEIFVTLWSKILLVVMAAVIWSNEIA